MNFLTKLHFIMICMEKFKLRCATKRTKFHARALFYRRVINGF